MFVLMCDIVIGAYRFRQVNDVKIEKTWREIGSKCSIKIPKFVSQYRTRSIEDVLNIGDPVTVKLRYLGLTEHTEFQGYVSKMHPNIPFEIECEDEVYYMKRTPVAKSWSKLEKVTLKKVVKYLVDLVNTSYPAAALKLSTQLPDVTFTEGFVIEAGNNAATALDKIRETFGLTSYLRGKEVFTGLAYQQTFGHVRHNLAWNVVETDLTYRRAEDTRIRIKPIGIKSDNTKIETKEIIGDKDGDLRTVYYYQVSDEKKLIALAKNDLTKYKFEGFEGSFTTFLYPYAEPLMITDLIDPIYQSRAGSYVIDSVITEFGVRGARRTIEAGIKVSA